MKDARTIPGIREESVLDTEQLFLENHAVRKDAPMLHNWEESAAGMDQKSLVKHAAMKDAHTVLSVSEESVKDI